MQTANAVVGEDSCAGVDWSSAATVWGSRSKRRRGRGAGVAQEELSGGRVRSAETDEGRLEAELSTTGRLVITAGLLVMRSGGVCARGEMGHGRTEGVERTRLSRR
jgi:hypothetical protein